MATYAVGDVQGCFAALEQILALANFNPKHDNLWLAGDLINRGPQSLEVLRFVKSLGTKAKCVLGNHDLHCIAIANGYGKLKKLDTLAPILNAPDCDDLIDWLCQQPLIHHDRQLGYAMVHAGIPAIWSLSQAKQLAQEVESALQGPQRQQFLQAMYGNQPDNWCATLSGAERLRVITNYLTRMRFCDQTGKLDLSHKGGPQEPPKNMQAWFDYPLQLEQQKLIFGHWAALEGRSSKSDLFALDTGFIWGGKLSLLRLDDEQLFQISAP